MGSGVERERKMGAALARARDLLAPGADDAVEKTIWGSPAGKKRLSKRLVAMLPPHSTYAEPFAGSGAVLFEKEPAAVEAINDADPEIADAYALIKHLTPADIERLKGMPWVGDKERFKKLIDTKPKDSLERLHRFLYLTHFSYGKLRGKSFSPSVAGVEATTIKRIEKFAPRLANVHIYSGDYEPVVRKYDGKDAAFFLDPPYPGYNVNVGESDSDEERFFARLKALKGKFLITYGVRGKFPAMVKRSKFWSKTIRTPRTISAMRGVGGSKWLSQLLVANYEPTRKSLDDWEESVESGADAMPAVEVEPAAGTLGFETANRLLKNLDPNDERYVLGIVLEPEVVDGQGDIYSPEEIRGAAHRFMEEFGGLGLMHRLRVNGQVKVLESYLAPTDFTVGDVPVRKGTWLFAVRVIGDDLWESVKSGGLTGFSIGGSARRVPEPARVSSTPPAAEGA